jgi:hypothetical protein
MYAETHDTSCMLVGVPVKILFGHIQNISQAGLDFWLILRRCQYLIEHIAEWQDHFMNNLITNDLELRSHILADALSRNLPIYTEKTGEKYIWIADVPTNIPKNHLSNGGTR